MLSFHSISFLQSAASSLTLLYRERDSRRQPHHAAEEQTDSLWHPFQSAAGALTQLYRESLEGMRLGTEGVRRSGYQKCRRDLASWASLHRRRYIRRDELLSLLASGMDSNNLQPQQQPALPIHQDLIFEAFSTANFAPETLPEAALSGTTTTLSATSFSCGAAGGGRTLKRSLCVTPPPPSSSPSSDKDVHMDTPSAKKPKPES